MSAEFIPHSGFGKGADLSTGTPLKSAEIASFIKTIGNEVYRKDEAAPKKSQAAFKPKSLLELAQEASERLRREAAAAPAAPSGDDDTGLPENDGTDDAAPGAALAADPSPEPDPQPQPDVDSDADVDAMPADDPGAGPDIEPSPPAAPLPEPGPDTAAQTQALEEAHARGFAEGQAAARDEVETLMSHALHLLAQTTAAFSDGAGAAISPMARAIESSVISLASARAGAQIDALPKAFLQRIEQLAQRVQHSVATPIVKLHPADLAVLQPMLEQSSKLLNLRLVPAEGMQRGDVDMLLGGIRLTDMLPWVEPPRDLVEYVPMTLAPDAMPDAMPDAAPEGASAASEEVPQAGFDALSDAAAAPQDGQDE
mgnify:CR=1 FL=1